MNPVDRTQRLRPDLRSGSGVVGAEGVLELELLDALVRVESDDRTFHEQLSHCFEPPERSAGSAQGPELLVRVRGATAGGGRPAAFAVSTEPEGALERTAGSVVMGAVSLTRAIVQWAVESTRRYYVFHASCVAREGRAVLLPAASGSGKSTLSAGLARRGFELLSDEVGAFDPASASLVGFSRSLNLRPDVLPKLGLADSTGLWPEEGEGCVARGSDLGIRRGQRARPHLLVAPEFATRSPTRLEPMSAGTALLTLVAASCEQQTPKLARLEGLQQLAQALPAFRLRFSDLEGALDAIESAHADAGETAPLIRTRPQLGQDPAELGTTVERPTASAPASSQPARRTDLVFREIDDEFFVFDPRADRTHLLNPTAALIFELCDGRGSAAEIAAGVATVFAVEPDRIREEVTQTLAEFAALGLLLTDG